MIHPFTRAPHKPWLIAISAALLTIGVALVVSG